VSPSTPEPLSLHTALYPPLAAIRAHAGASLGLYGCNLPGNKVVPRYKRGQAIVEHDGLTLTTRGGAYGKTLSGCVGIASKKNPSCCRGEEKEWVYTCFRRRGDRIHGLAIIARRRQENHAI